ncbi:hypothetical protein [Virgibacillus dokdonensis]|uniref:Uncharacterized protein n=1 Tax=Virgibacillus dokdonensis TaxID=302167 RepID=A0A2K9J509_9BACI|nr:hypothetical protein [Virgibacillus dokdonensis]AUJ27019.1 hypothetical protein A21D_03985 [Virgibacillus dokdonensis]
MFNRKSLFSLMTVFAITITSIFMGGQTASANTLQGNFNDQVNSNYDVQLVKSQKDYQKIRFVNKETGEEEFLEYTKTSEGESYKSIKGGKVQTFHREGNTIYKDDKVFDQLRPENKLHQPVAAAKASSWRKAATFKKSSSTDVNSVSATAGILASVVGGPATGVVVTMASFIVSEKIRTVYYKITQYMSTKTQCLAKNVTRVYKYSNYTGYIGTKTHKFYYCRPY